MNTRRHKVAVVAAILTSVVLVGCEGAMEPSGVDLSLAIVNDDVFHGQYLLFDWNARNLGSANAHLTDQDVWVLHLEGPPADGPVGWTAFGRSPFGIPPNASRTGVDSILVEGSQWSSGTYLLTMKVLNGAEVRATASDSFRVAVTGASIEGS